MEIIQSNLYQKLSRYKIHHIAFWLAYYVFWILLFNSRMGWSEAVVNASVVIFMHGAVSYFNIYVLFPKFLKKKEYLTYIVSILLSITLACFLLVIIFITINTISFESQEEVWSWGFFNSNAISISYTVAITMSLKMVKQWYERDKLTQNLERINTETELKYLKSQINPHFLFNSLNSIYALTLKKSDLAPELVLKLSEILRYVLYEAKERFVDLEKEVNYVQSYLDLEKMRHGDRLMVNFTTEGDLAGHRIAPMLFLTFLENSFKHGISSNAGRGYVDVKMALDRNLLTFVITNSKAKKPESRINGDSGGIGLENVKKRLNLLYPDKHDILISETPDSYVVELDLDLNEQTYEQ